jgi:hypothetical protein
MIATATHPTLPVSFFFNVDSVKGKSLVYFSDRQIQQHVYLIFRFDEGHNFVQVRSDVKVRRWAEGFVANLDICGAVKAECAHALSQMTVPGHIPATVEVGESVGVDLPLGCRFGMRFVIESQSAAGADRRRDTDQELS